MWKANNVEEYPLKPKRQTTQENARETRGNKNEKMIRTGRSTKSRASFFGDAPRIWNNFDNQSKIS